MAHYATPLIQRLPRVLVGLALGVALVGCSIWPQSWSLRSEPLPAQQTQEPAPPLASAASSPTTCADCAATAVAPQASAVVAPVATATPIAPAPDVAQPAPKVTRLEVVQAAPATPSPSPSPATPAPSAPHALAHGFYVNVGVFAVAQNANAVRGKLDGTGLPIVADTVKSKDAQATRIRVGPFAKRAQAQAAAKKIHALKLDAVVVRH